MLNNERQHKEISNMTISQLITRLQFLQMRIGDTDVLINGQNIHFVEDEWWRGKEVVNLE